MRKLILLVVIFVVTFWVFKNDFFFTPDSPEESSGSTEVEASGDSTPEADVFDSVVQPKDSFADEIDKLRSQADSEGDDGVRLQLAHALLDHGDRELRSEGIGILQSVFRGGSDLAPVAASLLLSEDEGVDLEVARYIVDQGADAPGFERACLTLGTATAHETDEKSQMEAWELLSAAYFGREDSPWREEIRPQLEKIVDRWILSTRPAEYTTSVTVQPGDSLSKIANLNKVTIDGIKRLNGLSSDVIHPGQRLKLLKGLVRVEVDKSDFRLDLLIDDRFLRSYRVGHGRDGCTPIGDFVVNIRQKKPDWTPRGRPVVPYGNPANPLGERWLGFQSTPQFSGYGIHGTFEPQTIGTESSDGCIRLTNEEVIELYCWIPRGTAVDVRE